MNKWFDKTNLASYAKTALLQAQKKIDQVLDIKEDDILLSLKTQEQQQQQQQQNQQHENKNNQNGFESIETKSPSLETDDFFSSFLGEKNCEIIDKNLEASNQKSKQNIPLVSSASSPTLITLSDLPKVNSTSDLFLNEDFRNNKLIDKEKQDWIQNYLDDNDKQQQQQQQDEVNEQEQELNKIKEFSLNNYITNEKITLSNNEEEEVSKSVDEIEFKEKSYYIEPDKEDSILKEDIKKDYNDYIKIDNISGNCSSNTDELETCASSDIEVLSLPSNNELVVNSGNNKKRSNVVIVKSPPPPTNLQQIKSSSTLNNLDASTSSSINTVISSTSTLQGSNQQQQESNELKLVLDMREMQIIKLNKQNVELQEKNDNLLNEIERIKIDLNQLKNDDLNRKAHADKKLSEQLQIELQEKIKLNKEKDEQIEQLILEGNKLSKQELNQSNIIKKLRAKEKENEDLISILKNENKKQSKENEELKQAFGEKEESEKQSIGINIIKLY